MELALLAIPALAQDRPSKTEAKALTQAANEYRALSRKGWQAKTGDMEAMLMMTWRDKKRLASGI